MTIIIRVTYLVLVETALPLQGQSGLHLLHLLSLFRLLQCVGAAQLLDQFHALLLALKHLWHTKGYDLTHRVRLLLYPEFKCVCVGV